mmetsp:Transcript_37566/g.88762  ORF Transcript_37566/g.88762 Transcript_37566/m.88762 type:complete len:265 (+) Transcript_37566:916-1710(+)
MDWTRGDGAGGGRAGRAAWTVCGAAARSACELAVSSCRRKGELGGALRLCAGCSGGSVSASAARPERLRMPSLRMSCMPFRMLSKPTVADPLPLALEPDGVAPSSRFPFGLTGPPTKRLKRSAGEKRSEGDVDIFGGGSSPSSSSSSFARAAPRASASPLRWFVRTCQCTSSAIRSACGTQIVHACGGESADSFASATSGFRALQPPRPSGEACVSGCGVETSWFGDRFKDTSVAMLSAEGRFVINVRVGSLLLVVPVTGLGIS